ncbi:MAG: histidinol-phosphatase HisJ family protein [Oscillospiraceae bacterium]|nr:histidinol-phosphatase HisJ family protein [Oscillospiraceae bacterium]
MYSNLFDSHTHTDNSFDGHHSAMTLCEAAVENGISGIAITDHCEIELFEEHNLTLRMRQSFFEAHKAKAVFCDDLIISCGIELGQPLAALDKTDMLLSSYNFDFVLCSTHSLPGQLDFALNYYKNYSAKQFNIMFAAYLRQVIRTIEWGNFDSLSHLTYPLRYTINKNGETVDLDLHRDLIDAVLKLLAEKGKALEINTSGLRQKLQCTLPTLDIVKRFRELGGELITLGSDAHFSHHIGANISDGMELAKAAGFDHVAFFLDRKPQMVKI